MKIVSAIKHVVFSLIFLSLLFGMIFQLGFVFRPMDDDDASNWTYFYDEMENTIDIVAMGSSAMYRFWIPPEIYEQKGYTSAMLATPGQDIHLVPYFMEEAMKTQNVKLFVIEMRNIVSYGAYDRKNVDISERIDYNRVLATTAMKPSWTRVKMLHNIKKNDGLQEWMEWQFPILKYHETAMNMTKEEMEERKALEERKVEYRYARQIGVVTPQDLPDYEDQVPCTLTDDEKNSIDAIVAMGDKLGVPVLMISTPYSPKNKEKAGMQNAMAAYIKEMGYPYLDMTRMDEELDLNYSLDFYDDNHTNINGARKVNSYLADYIEEHYDLPSEHNARIRYEWAKACAEWDKKGEELQNRWESNAKKVLAKLEADGQ